MELLEFFLSHQALLQLQPQVNTKHTETYINYKTACQ